MFWFYFFSVWYSLNLCSAGFFYFSSVAKRKQNEQKLTTPSILVQDYNVPPFPLDLLEILVKLL